MKKKVGIIVGSLRKGAFSQSIADEFLKQASDNLEYKFIDISKLPLYNQDYDDPSLNPKEYDVFRNEIKEVDAYLFVTPEHNRTYPAALKNALDIGSRPYGSVQWANKPAMVIGVSPGGIGGYGAVRSLKSTLSFFNVHVLGQPEAYIGSVMNLLDENGQVNNEDTKGFLKVLADSFEEWVNKF